MGNIDFIGFHQNYQEIANAELSQVTIPENSTLIYDSKECNDLNIKLNTVRSDMRNIEKKLQNEIDTMKLNFAKETEIYNNKILKLSEFNPFLTRYISLPLISLKFGFFSLILL